VFAVAAIAAVLSAYPVVFLGTSYVAPHYGATLLYNTIPTLPDYRDSTNVNNLGSDMGAIAWQHVPYGVIQRRALLRGELPFWNRYNTAGVPLLGQGQSMFGDPLQLLVTLCGANAWAWDAKYLVAKGLFAAGLGLLVLAIVRHVPAALIVAFAAPFMGFFNFRLNHPALFSLCYAPWPLYCWIKVSQARDRRALVTWIGGLMFTNFALMNSGTVKEAYMLLLCVNFSGVCVLLAGDESWWIRLGKLGVTGWAGVLFTLITIPIWGTFMHTLANAHTSYDVPSVSQIQPSLLLGAFDELFYRPLNRSEEVFCPSINFLLALGLLYFLATLRQSFSERTLLAVAASSVMPLAFAFGLVPTSWIIHVPLLGNVAHIDNCFSCALLILWSVLAGAGFARAAERLKKPEGRADIAIAALLLFGVVFAWIAFRQTAHRAPWGSEVTFTVLQPGQTIPVSPFVWGNLIVVLVATVLFAWITRRAVLTRTLTPASGILLALAAMAMVWRGANHAKAVGFENYLFHPALRPDFFAHSDAVEFLQSAQSREPTRAIGLPGNFAGGWTGVYGLETIWGPDALMNRPFRELILASAAPDSGWVVAVPLAVLPKVRRLFDAFNVRYYLDSSSDPAALRAMFTPVNSSDLDIYESTTAWPRAFFTDRVAPYDEASDFIKLLNEGDGRPFAAVQKSAVSPEPALASFPNELAGRAIAAATNYTLTENTTSFDIHAPGRGVVVLTETYWPGDFRAEIDGQKTAILRVNHAFKGVLIDRPGTYHITFRYLPKNFPRYLVLCGAGTVLLFISACFGLRPARPVDSPQ
jgi:hypothetical protein